MLDLWVKSQILLFQKKFKNNQLTHKNTFKAYQLLKMELQRRNRNSVHMFRNNEAFRLRFNISDSTYPIRSKFYELL